MCLYTEHPFAAQIQQEDLITMAQNFHSDC